MRRTILFDSGNATEGIPHIVGDKRIELLITAIEQSISMC